MVRVKVRRIGNSLGVILPKDEVEAQGLEEGDEVEVSVRPALTFEDLQGRFKDPELTVDELNDLADEGEDLG